MREGGGGGGGGEGERGGGGGGGGGGNGQGAGAATAGTNGTGGGGGGNSAPGGSGVVILRFLTQQPKISLGQGSDVNGTAYKRNYLNLNFSINGTAGGNLTVAVSNGSGVLSFQNVSYNITGTNNISFANLANGEYWVNSSLKDEGNLNTSANFTFEIDSTIPLLTFNSPSVNNASRFRTLPTINITCADENLFECGFGIYNATHLIYSNITSLINFTTYSHNVTLARLPRSGNYTIRANASDDLTFSPEIPNLGVETDAADTVKFTDNKTGLWWTITPQLYNKGGASVNKAAAAFQSATSKSKRQYKTNYLVDFSALPPAEGSKLVLRVESNKPITPRTAASGEAGHLVLGKAYYWSAQDIANEGLTVTTVKVSEYIYDVIITDNDAEKWADHKVLDPRTGGLNVVNGDAQFLFDNQAPQWVNNGTNDTIGMRKTVGFKINWTDDIDLSAIVFEHNLGSNASVLVNDTFLLSGAFHNLSVNKTVPDGMGNVARWKWYANDTLGNWNSTDNFNSTFCVETWEATGWVANGSFEYRNLNDTSNCGTTFIKPLDKKPVDEWFLASVLLVAGTIFIMGKAGLELDRQHWPLKIGLLYGAMSAGWGALAIIMGFAQSAEASAQMQTSLAIFYGAYTTLLILAFAYMLIRVISYFMFKGVGVEQEAWEGEKEGDDKDG